MVIPHDIDIRTLRVRKRKRKRGIQRHAHHEPWTYFPKFTAGVLLKAES